MLLDLEAGPLERGHGGVEIGRDECPVTEHRRGRSLGHDQMHLRRLALEPRDPAAERLRRPDPHEADQPEQLAPALGIAGLDLDRDVVEHRLRA
jgi:hypothetical protein